MSYHFFTEPSKLDNQVANKAFGAIDENQYRLGNLFSSNSAEAPKAFSVTDGLVLVQQIGTTNKYNIILKPTAQPDLNLPKIDYIIYKGVKKDSLIDGNKVASPSKNDLTRLIHESAQQWYQVEGATMPSTEPAANTSLGLAYNATTTEAGFQMLDIASLNEVFYASNDITLPFVFSGNYIGDFDNTGDFGIVIIFEKIGFKPTFQLARELDSILSINALPTTPSNAEIFRRKHQKEDALCFLDSGAFFGAFSMLGLKVFDGTFSTKLGDDLYNEVTSKHFNKNKLYLDIRNESDDSFNYYENYNNTIQWSLDNTNTLVDVDYYRNDGWPILVIDDTAASGEFDVANTEKVIKLSFPRGDNESPLFYYKRAYKEDLGFELPDGTELFLSTSVIDGRVSLENLITPKVGDRVSSNYFQIKVIRRVILENDETNDFPRQGYTLFKRSYLDNLFPVFDMEIPFTNPNYTNLKVYYDSAFIDKVLVDDGTLNDTLTDYALRDFVSTTGIASDTNNITFISFPFKYHTNADDNDDFIPLSGLEDNNANPFLIEMSNLISQVNLVRSNFLIGGVNREYLNFINTDIVNGEQTNNQYSFDDVIILSITRAEYQALEQLKQQNFTGPYKVYLGIKNISVLTDDNGSRYSSFTYVLRGLTENNGQIEIHEEVSTITSITADSVLGINSGHIFPIQNPYIEEDYGERNGRHNGIDIEATTDGDTPGQPIFAVWSGTVVRIVKEDDLLHSGGNDRNLGGVRIRILGDNGIHYNYFHMEPGSNDNFNLDDNIQQGTQIGRIGLSGNGYGVNPNWVQYHLHFELWSNDSPVTRISPYSVFPELALLPYERHRD